MSRIEFDRDATARWHAREHLEVDPGVRRIYYLPTDAPDREIRLLEVDDLIAERRDDALEPLDFGVDIDSDTGHTLMVLDVTPSQWESIDGRCLPLPDGWSMEGIQVLGEKSS